MRFDVTRIAVTSGVIVLALSNGAFPQTTERTGGDALYGHRERPDDPPYTGPNAIPPGVTAGRAVVERAGFISVQVNVDADGNNISGDAANEPSIAIDPTNPAVLVIGWRQFDSVRSNFRQAGWAYSHDAGRSWTFPGVLEPGVFRSDPVLGADSEGNIYFYSLSSGYQYWMFKSLDGGITWGPPVFAYGGDKGWFTIDRTNGPGHGHIYATWTGGLNRSVDAGATFQPPQSGPIGGMWGTLSVGPDGELYVAGEGGVARSDNAQSAGHPMVFADPVFVGMGSTFGAGPNPGGLLGQTWVATDHSRTPSRGNVYVLVSSGSPGPDPLDVLFTRSTDGGQTWSKPVRLNDDSVDSLAWQWFGTMSVAPNGRIDVVWNDTRNDRDPLYPTTSDLYYSFSGDAGFSWSTNVPVSPPFEHHVGYPNQEKLGDYYDMISDNAGANVAYAATFNGEQDVYYLRIGDLDCNGNGHPDADDVATGTSADCNNDSVPDECGRDCNRNGTLDVCETNMTDCNNNLVPDECEPNVDGDKDIDGCDDDMDNDGLPNTEDRCPRTPVRAAARRNGEPVGDFNSDCRIVLEDYARLRNCISTGGPGNTQLSDAFCYNPFDFDADRNIDLIDAAWFQRVFTGP